MPRGATIAIVGRLIDNASDPETPLFHKSRILYGFDRAKVAIRKLNCAVLVEGQMDLLASHQAGWGNTVAVSGTAFTPEHANLIRRMTDNLVLALDADEAGIKAAGRAARAALQGGLNVKVAQIPDGLDPADLIQKQGADAWKAVIKNSKDIITFLLDVLEKHAKNTDNFRRSVELVVLPFLSDVQSPIAREQYVQEIAKRLHVSEAAVTQAFAKMPKQPGPQTSAREVVLEKKSAEANGVSARGAQAYGILLWQTSQKKPQIDIKKYTDDLKEALGEDVFNRLKSLSEAEKESLRFNVERDLKEETSLERAAEELLRVVREDRINTEHAAATLELRQAEERGDEKAVDILKKRIAKRRYKV